MRMIHLAVDYNAIQHPITIILNNNHSFEKLIYNIKMPIK